MDLTLTLPPKGLNKKKIKKETKKIVASIVELQRKMNAEGSQGLLVVFQGMDASGKDGRKTLETQGWRLGNTSALGRIYAGLHAYI